MRKFGFSSTAEEVIDGIDLTGAVRPVCFILAHRMNRPAGKRLRSHCPLRSDRRCDWRQQWHRPGDLPRPGQGRGHCGHVRQEQAARGGSRRTDPVSEHTPDCAAWPRYAGTVLNSRTIDRPHAMHDGKVTVLVQCSWTYFLRWT